MLTAERLHELMEYSPQTGLLTWRAPISTRVHAGDVAGHVDKEGYRRIRTDGRYYLAHRLAWLWVTGAWPKHEIDHKNRDRSDNRWANIREATDAQNAHNGVARRNSWTGTKGVVLYRRPGPDDPDDKVDDDQWGEPDDGGKRRKKGKKAAEPEDTTPERDEAEKAVRALQALHAENYERGVTATAQAIILAGKLRRGTAGAKRSEKPRNTVIPGARLPPEGSMARAIIDAGRKRRSELT